MLSGLPYDMLPQSAVQMGWTTAIGLNHRKDEFLAETDSEGAMSEKGLEDSPLRKSFHESPRMYENPNIIAEPRSVAMGSPTTFKCRQLPCRTFISTGSCPYGDRCVFLHCAEIMSKPIYIKTKRKSKEDVTGDAFFWPTMSLNSVLGKTDLKNMPHIAQPYIVSVPTTVVGLSTSNNESAVFSMWEHFLDFCKSDALSIVPVPRKVPTLNPYVATNGYTGKRRLGILVRLSQGQQAWNPY